MTRILTAPLLSRIVLLFALGVGSCDRPPAAPVTPPRPPRPPEYRVECRRQCSGAFSFWREREVVGGVSLPGAAPCEQVRNDIDRQPMGVTITTREADPDAQLAECIAHFDEPTSARVAGRQLSVIELSWLQANPEVRQGVLSRSASCRVAGIPVYSLECEPPAEDALISVTEVSSLGSPGAIAGSIPRCEDDDRGTVGESCMAIPAGCGDSPLLPGEWVCRLGGVLSCVVDEATFCRGGEAGCGGVAGSTCTSSDQCVPGGACDLRAGRCVALPPDLCPPLPTCWLSGQTNTLCPVSDADPAIPASARECTASDEGSDCTGTVLGCGAALLPGKVTCVAGSKSCIHDPDVVGACGIGDP